jgi:uncharacterized membrane protein
MNFSSARYILARLASVASYILLKKKTKNQAREIDEKASMFFILKIDLVITEGF